MKTISNTVIGAIRAQICGKQSKIWGAVPDNILNEVYTFSKAQDVAHIIAAEMLSQKTITNQEIGALFKKQQILAVYRYERMHQEYTDICRALDEAGIPYMPLKGAVMCQYYPEPWMRTSSDIDILVKPKDIPAATEALVSKLCYQNKGTNEHDVQLLAPSGVHLELHFATVEDYRLPAANKVLETIWTEHAVPLTGQCYAMSDEMFYFYHIAHMAKHFQEGGCGIRFFIDMWLLNHRIKYNRAQRDALLKKGELFEFAHNMERLSEIWFGEQFHDEITKRIESFILNGGLYGSKDNKMATTHVKKNGRFGYAMYLIFRPYHELKGTYRILYKHKWLYPFCQMHRWVSLLCNNGFSRANRVLNDGAKAYERDGDSVKQMFIDLNLGDKSAKG